MIIYPAIDIKNGKCVRLRQGKKDNETIYGDDPADMAVKWQENGAGFLHVVDLDGAFSGKSDNIYAVHNIISRVKIPVQLGGGIRSMDDIVLRLEEIGVDRVILGTIALENPEIVKKAVQRYSDRIIVGVDAYDGKVATHGWVKKTEQTSIEVALKMKSFGIQTIIYTDIFRDGMLSGPNIESIKKMINGTEMNIIASGGVQGLQDIKTLKEIGAYGVIIGKALYTGAIKLKDALSLQEDESC